MSAEASSLNCLYLDAKSGLHRPVADFHPSVWKDYFLQYVSDSMEFVHNFGVQIETLKEEVRKMLVLESEKPLAKLDLIDSICRLGVNRHFEFEIFEVLKHVHMDYVENEEIILEDNHRSLAMLFRLLRQHGFHVSPNVFNKFKDEQGNFSGRSIIDFEGILNLYEASHMRIHEEYIVEEAFVLTSSQLESIVIQLNPFLATQVNHSLGQSLHKNLPRLEFKKVVHAYMTEAKWLNNNYIPTTEEYMRTSTISCCYSLLITTSYIGMGNTITEDIFKWVTNEPKIVKAASVLCRLMDDIVSNEFEQKRGHVCSFLECYMKEYGVSRDAAIDECRKRITLAWKDINEECLRPNIVPMHFLMRILNLSRFLVVFYKDDHNYTHSEGLMKTSIKALLVDSIPI
ncbi:hypothetical protein VNO77_37150 [Canavalia gladiata]|uniref:Uncharacterized protein n=1 Tax=Canavalia gladiata TaxID=3824 RepID=A0AAN9KBT9_CANGL